jgi:C-terminal processing protease CtpA/Prc
VRLGDRLLEVNGHPVSEMRFEEIKDAFRAQPGTRVRLRLRSSRKASRETVLILRDLL